MRQRAAAADVVIVNHHLLCADAAVRHNKFGEVIPACSRAIVDEAHQLEDVATQYFGYSVSNYRIEELARDVERLVATGAIDERAARDEVAQAIERLRDHARGFFADLAFAHRGEGRARSENRVRATATSLGEAYDAASRLIGALEVVDATLTLLATARPTPDITDGDNAAIADDDRSEDLAALAARAAMLRDELRFLLRGGDEECVYFVEFR